VNAALLLELDATGVRLWSEGDDLYFQTRPGVSIAFYRVHIMAHKPALLAELLKTRIIETVTANPADFDRAEYERLWARWKLHAAAGATP
jgi:hypothetical protein